MGQFLKMDLRGILGLVGECDGNVGGPEIVTHEQERFVQRTRQCVGKAVTKVEPGAMPAASTKSTPCDASDCHLIGGDRFNFRAESLQEVGQQGMRAWRTSPVKDHPGLKKIGCGYPDHVMFPERSPNQWSGWLLEGDRHQS